MTDAIQKAREALRGQLTLLHSLANDTTEANWRDKRLYILQTCVRMSDALAALDAETEGWRTIDSAPKDGTEVIYLTSYGSRWIGNEPPGHARGIWTLVDGEWRGMSSSSNDVAWHSLPSPPESRS